MIATRTSRFQTGERFSGRRRAYGYWQVERFLSQVAQAGGDERVTSALAQWTAALWPGGEPEPLSSPWYLDGHKKPVLNEDLTRLCERVSQAAPGLPDGRHLLFTVGTIRRPILGPYKRRVA